MKKLFTIACALVLGGALSFAQSQTAPASGSTDTSKSDTTKKSKKHHHKAGKKAKKGATSGNAGSSTTPK